MILFSTNPFMFKVNQINGDYLNVGSSAGSILGSAVHRALQVFFGGDKDIVTSADVGEATQQGLEAGLKYINEKPDAFIDWNKTIYNKEKMIEYFTFCYFGFMKEGKYAIKDFDSILFSEKKMQHAVEFDGKVFPVPLKGITDLVWRDEQGRIIIDDFKTAYEHSDLEKIDAKKLVQSVVYFFLVWAETGERPYAIRFMEYRYRKYQDETKKQLNQYLMPFEDLDLGFELFYRLYDDITNALLGKQVYIPNFNALYDNEEAVLAYIYRLDETETREKLMKKEKVTNITDLLQKKIQKTGKMKKYLETVAAKFISGNTLNYSNMEIQDKIKMKMAEHGIALDFRSKVQGGSVTLYQYEPSIGLKMSRLEKYVKDIEQVVQRQNVRVLAPIPNTDLVGFEVPNEHRNFKPLPDTETSYEMVVGESITGETRTFDIRHAPHMLIAGATRSGKSVFMTNVIKQTIKIPDAEVVLYDPKIVELKKFAKEKNVIEYLTSPLEIQKHLCEMVDDMNKRYKTIADHDARDISEIEGQMKYRFIFLDEFGDLAKTADKEVVHWNLCKRHARANDDLKGEIMDLLQSKRKLRVNEEEMVSEIKKCAGCEKHVYRPAIDSVLLLAQKGRAAGIHIILATQRPSVDIISGTVKANFPTKVAFRMAKETDSRVLIDEAGAEKLLGMGDMLFQSEYGLERLQGYSL